MKYGLKLSEEEIERVDFLLKTHNNRAAFKREDQTFFLIIGTYESLKTSLFDKLDEAKELKEAAINYVMNDFLGKHYVSTTFGIRIDWLKTNEFVMIYTENHSIPEDLFVNAREFEIIKRDRK
ncbi:hypothetical protein [Bacillus paramycoides]|uniref:hypothetical protein n=1 Tax=Bacillus paramycoides TaxID=2026194 RepID=UPI003825FCD1